MEIHFFGVVVGLYIAQAMGVRCGIYLDTMHFLRLTVAGNAQGIGSCTRTEDANPFPCLHQARHPQPFSSHAGREKAGGKIQMQGQAIFPVYSTQTLFSGDHLQTDKPVHTTVLSMAEGHHPDMGMQGQDGFSYPAGLWTYGMGQSQEGDIANRVEATGKQVPGNVGQAEGQGRPQAHAMFLAHSGKRRLARVILLQRISRPGQAWP